MKVHARFQVHSNVEQQQQLANSKCALSFFHSHHQQQSTQLWLKKYNIYTTTVCACPQV